MVTAMCALKKVHTNIDCGPISKIFEIRNLTNYHIMDNGSRPSWTNPVVSIRYQSDPISTTVPPGVQRDCKIMIYNEFFSICHLFFLILIIIFFWCAPFGYHYFQFFFNVIASKWLTSIHPVYGVGV
jgi:hypothetical protein